MYFLSGGFVKRPIKNSGLTNVMWFLDFKTTKLFIVSDGKQRSKY